MDKKTKIAVLGDGGWGTALAVLLAAKGHQVSLWGAFKDNIDSIVKARENKKFLPGIKLPEPIKATSSMSEALEDKKAVVLAIPSRFLRNALVAYKKDLCSKGTIFVSVVKGLEEHTLKRMSEVVNDVLGDIKLSVLSGPSIAPEVARLIPTTVVVSSRKKEISVTVRDIFMTERFRVYTNEDIIGVELGGALKNIIAIAVGISDGLGFGANTKAALLTRGLIEMSRLGEKLGAYRETFNGLTGLGDLITTSISREGRNRGFGEEIGKGKDPKEILKNSIVEIEGAWTVKAAVELGKKHNIELPITKEVYSVIFENKSPILAVKELMMRDPKAE
ncbi:MAG: NAD(P)H-dependent glycerol-3-phosphate dehydrogenase [Candidatus Omnitrophota bacterium]